MIAIVDGFEMNLDEWTLYDSDSNYWLFECWHCKNLNSGWGNDLEFDWLPTVDSECYGYFEIYIRCPNCAVWNMCAEEINYK